MTQSHTRGPRRLLRSAAAISVVVVAVLSGACGDDEQADTTTSSTSTTEATGSSVDPGDGDGSSGSSAAPLPGEVLWPAAGSDTTYEDPVEAARDFAVELVGFVEPVVGGLVETETDRGTVEVRPGDGGPVTTVVVHRGDAGDWSVEAAATAEIALEAPSAGDEVGDPVVVRGTSTAFEGTVQVAVRDDAAAPLGSGFVTGGANGEMGPFSGEVPFDAGDAAGGSVALYTLSMEDGGGVLAATVVPVRFGS